MKQTRQEDHSLNSKGTGQERQPVETFLQGHQGKEVYLSGPRNKVGLSAVRKVRELEEEEDEKEGKQGGS